MSAALPLSLPFPLPLALAALIPVLIGPLPASGQTLTAQLCNGGTITIPLGDNGGGGGSAPGEDRPCHPKGCHAGPCREKHETGRPKRAI